MNWIGTPDCGVARNLKGKPKRFDPQLTFLSVLVSL